MEKHISRHSIFPRGDSRAATLSFAVIVILMTGWTHPAAAQVSLGGAVTIGDMMCNAYNNLGPLAPLMSVIAWVLGGIIIGNGAIHLKDHAENPGNRPLYQAIAKMAAGSALMAVPYTAGLIINTLYIAHGPGGALICSPNMASTGGPFDLVTALENFVGNITVPLINLVSVVAWVMGSLFIIRGLVRGSKYGTDPRASSMPHILAYLIVGGLLLVAGETAGNVQSSVLGFGSTSIMNYALNVGTVLGWRAVQEFGGNVEFATAISAALTFIQLIGMLAFVRGLYIVKNAVEGAGQATMAQGFTHMIGGVIAVNIFNFLEIVDATFGTNLLT